MENNICQLNSFCLNWSFLSLQVKNSHVEMVSFLLEIANNYNKDIEKSVVLTTNPSTIIQLMANKIDTSKEFSVSNFARCSNLCPKTSYGRHMKTFKYHNDYDIHCTIEYDNEITPLYLCCLQGHADIAEYILENVRCKPHKKTTAGRTYLHAACTSGNLMMVSTFTNKYKLDPNVMDTNGVTPIYLACENGHESIMKYFLKLQTGDSMTYLQEKKYIVQNCNCNICIKTAMGRTYLHAACTGGSLCIVEALINEYKLDPYALDVNSITPLYVACESGHESIVKFLIEDNCKDVEFQKEDGKTYGLQKNIIEENILEKIKYLRTTMGRTYLHAACTGGSLYIVVTLINRYKLDPNATDAKGMTPLYMACESGHESIIKYLVEDLCIDVKHLTEDGKTYLHAACSSGNINVIKLIATNNEMDLNQMDNNDVTPLDIAISHGDVEAANEMYGLIQKHYSINSIESKKKVFDILDDPKFFSSVNLFHYDVRQLIITLKDNFTELCSIKTDKNNLENYNSDDIIDLSRDDIILLYACASDNIELAKIIVIEKKHDIPEIVGISCCVFSCANSNVKMIQLLLQKKSWIDNLNHQKLFGTLMHVIAIFGDPEMFEYLKTHHNANSFHKLMFVIFKCHTTNGNCIFSKDVISGSVVIEYHSSMFHAFNYGSLEIIMLIP